MRRILFVAVPVFFFALASRAVASPVTVDFDSLNDGDAPGTILNATFSAGTVLRDFGAPTFPGSLNTNDFPPNSNYNVLGNLTSNDPQTADVTPITITFANPVYSVFGFFTFFDGVTFTAFDGSNNVLDVDTGSGDNTASGASPNPNVKLSLSSSTAISYITIDAGPASQGLNAIMLDDLTYDTTNPNDTQPAPVPEPGTMLLLLTGGAALARKRFMKRA